MKLFAVFFGLAMGFLVNLAGDLFVGAGAAAIVGMMFGLTCEPKLGLIAALGISLGTMITFLAVTALVLQNDLLFIGACFSLFIGAVNGLAAALGVGLAVAAKKLLTEKE
jgi:hypothetical protein